MFRRIYKYTVLDSEKGKVHDNVLSTILYELSERHPPSKVTWTVALQTHLPRVPPDVTTIRVHGLYPTQLRLEPTNTNEIEKKELLGLLHLK